MSREHRHIPDATYRLQLGPHRTLDDAAALVPYLAELGISHLYCSPCMLARRGSLHGYDVTDHGRFNPELGGEDAYQRLITALRAHGMGQILDLVPNHMGIGGDDNRWWLDVLENGPASAFAHYFDIDWQPALQRLRGRVLLPILGEHYGTVLEAGEIRLTADTSRGQLGFCYGIHYLPMDPATYPLVLRGAAARMGEGARAALERMAERFSALPPCDTGEEHQRRARRRRVPVLKERLARLCHEQPQAAQALQRESQAFHGDPEQEHSFDALHHLLEHQPWRLAHWRVAADEINYRRFFDINDLACLRMEERDVFDDVHRLVRSLSEAGQLDGLRVDHVDGLHNPEHYLRRLREFFPGYLVVEKILAPDERLPAQWPVEGTTGYDHARLALGVLIHPDGKGLLSQLYRRFTAAPHDFGEILHHSKRLVIHSQLSSELTMLANMADTLAQADRHTRDFTLNALRNALAELVARFPVYRSYVAGRPLSKQDRLHLDFALQQALAHGAGEDAAVYRFLHELLLLDAPALQRRPALYERAVRLAQRFQQYTAPVMAKGLEDTALYRYHRLCALNEVGNDPRRFSETPEAFHENCRRRLAQWPHTMLGGSTHDSKRGEDVRARLAVLSEIPELWRKRVFRWSRLHRRHRTRGDHPPTPSRNDEYLFYQTLVGSWPARDEHIDADYVERLVTTMNKSAREAALRTSWINPDTEYEQALEHFVRAVLGAGARGAFMRDFLPFQQRVANAGAINGLALALIRYTAPGVPDIYQGNELWRLDLVDPDNRRPVDMARRRALLSEIRTLRQRPDAPQHLAALALQPRDDRVKLLVTWAALQWRGAHPELFHHGTHEALSAQGDAADHVLAFARCHGRALSVTATVRFPATLLRDGNQTLPDNQAWGNTCLELPAMASSHCIDVLTGRRVHIRQERGRAFVAARDLFALLPVALLTDDRADMLAPAASALPRPGWH